MEKDSFYLGHILDAIGEIEAYISGLDFRSFSENSMVQSAVIRQIEIIGEAARSLSDGLRRRYTDIDWPAIIAMRNKLIHDYFEVDLSLVWDAAKNEVVILKDQVKDILDDIDVNYRNT